MGRALKSLQGKSGKSPGGQPCHLGHTPTRRSTPDACQRRDRTHYAANTAGATHALAVCAQCGHGFTPADPRRGVVDGKWREAFELPASILVCPQQRLGKRACSRCDVPSLRELSFLAEERASATHQWDTAFKRALHSMKRGADRARAAGATALDRRTLGRSHRHHTVLLGRGGDHRAAACAHRGCWALETLPRGQLLARLRHDREAEHRFLHDFAAPFEHSDAMRDRWAQGQRALTVWRRARRPALPPAPPWDHHPRCLLRRTPPSTARPTPTRSTVTGSGTAEGAATVMLSNW
jgi:hypothetical protein